MPKNDLLPSIQQFRTDYPEFANETRYPDAIINRGLRKADAILDQNIQGSQFVELAELCTAHYAELGGKTLAAAAAGGVNTSSRGVLTSKSVDKVSASYDVSGVVDPDAGFWNSTGSGSEFFWWWSMYGAGGRQLL
ncbi:hypothetical protein TUM17576_28260 [Enterobacter hormaechei]|nr:DUF4054 domain-containing protein [Enterobacter hormaechei]GJL36006.1 hypothetical protein TUM17576_28260 [Enterobacter hormaechei]